MILRDARTSPLAYAQCRRIGHLPPSPSGRCPACRATVLPAPDRESSADPTVVVVGPLRGRRVG